MFDVHIHNAQDAVEVDEPFLREVVVHTLQSEDVTDAEVSVAVVDDPTIHELNRQFLNHDEPTDVLSFSLDEDESARSQGFDKSLGPSSMQIDGEIVLSAETARRRAAEFGWSPADEIVLYLVHGLLHLAGHDDQTYENRTAMRTRERAVLAHWGLAPRYDEPPSAHGDDCGLRIADCGVFDNAVSEISIRNPPLFKLDSRDIRIPGREGEP